MASRVLIAHDSPVARFWIKGVLRRLAAECVEADSSSALESHLSIGGPFDLVVMSAGLPGVSSATPLAALSCPLILVHEIRGHHAMVALDSGRMTERLVVSEKAFGELAEERLQRRSGTALSPASARPASRPAPSSRRLG